MENRTYAERLAELRKKYGLTQFEFAKKFGIPRDTYSQWEHSRRIPSPHIVSMIERIVELEEIMNDRIQLAKRIETIEIYQKVLEKAGLYCPNDADVAKFEQSGNLGTIKKGDMTYYIFKDDSGYQACYEPCYEKFIEKEQIEALIS